MSQRRYYTNVARAGNYLLVREIRNGARRKFKVPYQPTLYLPTRNESEWRGLDGSFVEPIKPGSMTDCRQFLEQYKDVQNFKVYGNTSYEYAFIAEEYPGEIDYKISDLVICNLDIEVASRHGFPEPSEATEEVTAITVRSSKDGKFHVFGCGVFVNTQPDVIYHRCEDEADLLEKYLRYWETTEPDIITGWNCRTFDTPYLVNRIAKVLSEEDSRRLSLWRKVREGKVNVFNKQIQVYELSGIAILDYLMIYRKNVLEPRESYKLDHIAEVELGEKKIDYGEYSGLQELYEKNYQKFIEYNIHDVRLVDRIDKKRKLIELQLLVAYHSKVNYVDVLSQVRTWEAAIHNFLGSRRQVSPIKTTPPEKKKLEGAFVMMPKIGMHKWVCSEDVASLYPNIIRTLNIGNDTKLEGHQLSSELRQFRNNVEPRLMRTDEEGKLIVNLDSVLEGVTEEILALAQQANLTIAVNGQFYDKTHPSIFSEMIETLFNNRVEYKAKVRGAELELEAIKNELKQREKVVA